MRTILNISIPKKEEKLVRDKVKNGGFDSISHYIRSLVDMDTDLISSNTILKLAEKSKKLYGLGKLKKLKSLRDLTK